MRSEDLPFVFRPEAVIPDLHSVKDAAEGSVIPSQKVIIPAAVGVDIEFPEPKNSDLVINNDVDNLDFNLIADEIFKNYLAKNL